MTVKELFDALAYESGGGVTPSEPLAAQGIRALMLFLENGEALGIDLALMEGVTPHD